MHWSACFQFPSDSDNYCMCHNRYWHVFCCCCCYCCCCGGGIMCNSTLSCSKPRTELLTKTEKSVFFVWQQQLSGFQIKCFKLKCKNWGEMKMKTTVLHLKRTNQVYLYLVVQHQQLWTDRSTTGLLQQQQQLTAALYHLYDTKLLATLEILALHTLKVAALLSVASRVKCLRHIESMVSTWRT